MSLNHILLGGTWERLTLRSRALVAIRRNCYVQQNFNSWWKTSDERTQTFLFPFLFIYLFIYLFIVWVQFSVHRCFGLHWKPQEYFWVLNFAHHSCPFKSVSPPPPPPPPPVGDTGKGFHFDLCSYTVSFPSWTLLSEIFMFSWWD